MVALGGKTVFISENISRVCGPFSVYLDAPGLFGRVCKLSVLSVLVLVCIFKSYMIIMEYYILISVKVDTYFNTLKLFLIWDFLPTRGYTYVVNMAISYLVTVFTSSIQQVLPDLMEFLNHLTIIFPVMLS